MKPEEKTRLDALSEPFRHGLALFNTPGQVEAGKLIIKRLVAQGKLVRLRAAAQRAMVRVLSPVWVTSSKSLPVPGDLASAEAERGGVPLSVTAARARTVAREIVDQFTASGGAPMEPVAAAARLDDLVAQRSVDGKERLIPDFSGTLNKWLQSKTARLDLPQVDEVLAGDWRADDGFHVMDLREAYYQQQMHPEAWPCTVVYPTWASDEWYVM